MTEDNDEGNDIWALSGISFISPVNDLLDRGDFSLEELLHEDELIQEVKSRNDRLISFLTHEKTVESLISYIIIPADTSADDLRNFKYPYMSCEVICCEVPELLHAIVEDYDGKFLCQLFSFLSDEKMLNNYLAGYFEKILEMLFRQMTVSMMQYFNSHGMSLLQSFLKHIDNYSIMLVVQRLLLPHIPFSNSPEMECVSVEEIKELYECNWSYNKESFTMLFDAMLASENPDVPLHIADLLITVLQLSPPETLVIKFLSEPTSIERLLNSVVSDCTDSEHVDGIFSSSAGVCLASISVLESLISRLLESNVPFDASTDFEAVGSHDPQSDDFIHNIGLQIVPFIPQINSILCIYASHKTPCGTVVTQGKKGIHRLGHRGLQLVKLIESVVRLGVSELDISISSSGLLKTCLDLFFCFENNSLLHLSVQRILITIIEGDATRSAAQSCILNDCDFIHIAVARLSRYDTADEEGDEVVDKTDSKTSKTPTCSLRHTSILGNMILIAQALSAALEVTLDSSLDENCENDSFAVTEETPHSSPAKSAFVDDLPPKFKSLRDIGSDDKVDALPIKLVPGPRDVAPDGPTSFLIPGGFSSDTSAAMTDVSATCSQDYGSKMKTNLRSLVADPLALQAWDEFVDTKLRSIIDHQISGSFQQTSTSEMFINYQNQAGHALKEEGDTFPFGEGGDFPNPELLAEDDDRWTYLEEDDDDNGDSDEDEGRGQLQHATNTKEESAFVFDDTSGFADFANFADFENPPPASVVKTDSQQDPFTSGDPLIVTDISIPNHDGTDEQLTAFDFAVFDNFDELVDQTNAPSIDAPVTEATSDEIFSGDSDQTDTNNSDHIGGV